MKINDNPQHQKIIKKLFKKKKNDLQYCEKS